MCSNCTLYIWYWGFNRFELSTRNIMIPIFSSHPVSWNEATFLPLPVLDLHLTSLVFSPLSRRFLRWLFRKSIWLILITAMSFLISRILVVCLFSIINVVTVSDSYDDSWWRSSSQFDLFLYFRCHNGWICYLVFIYRWFDFYSLSDTVILKAYRLIWLVFLHCPKS